MNEVIIVTQVIITFPLLLITVNSEYHVVKTLNYILVSSPHPLHHSLFQEVELLEACWYGMVGLVHHLLTTGVNVNVTEFVSDQHDIDFVFRFSVLCQSIHAQML